MKCGTTSLHNYLNMHPEIYMHKEKALDFFIDKRNYNKGLDWYSSKFKMNNVKIYGESSPNYSKYPFFNGVPERIYKHLPRTKLIYIVRDPIERLISHFYHNFAVGREKRKFSECFKNLDNNIYIVCSMYFLQINQYLNYFSVDNILIIDSIELLSERNETLNKVFSFLKVDEKFASNEFNNIIHETKKNKIDNKLAIFFSKKGYKTKMEIILPEFIYSLFFKKSVIPPSINKNILDEIKHFIKNDIIEFKKLSDLNHESWYI